MGENRVGSSGLHEMFYFGDYLLVSLQLFGVRTQYLTI